MRKISIPCSIHGEPKNFIGGRRKEVKKYGHMHSIGIITNYYYEKLTNTRVSSPFPIFTLRTAYFDLKSESSLGVVKSSVEMQKIRVPYRQ